MYKNLFYFVFFGLFLFLDTDFFNVYFYIDFDEDNKENLKLFAYFFKSFENEIQVGKKTVTIDLDDFEHNS